MNKLTFLPMHARGRGTVVIFIMIAILAMCYLYKFRDKEWTSSGRKFSHSRPESANHAGGRRWHYKNVDAVTTCASNAMLPPSVLENVEKYVMFIGHSRSGHSIIGSMLDSHPHMVISYQSNILGDILSRPEKASSRSFIFNTIWKKSCYMMEDDSKRLRNNFKNYDLFFDGLYQGKYDTYIDVIGDKQGAQASQLFMRDPGEFQKMFHNLQAALNMPIKVIHAVRSPFDNIATASLYGHVTITTNGRRSLNTSLLAQIKAGNDAAVIDSKIVDDKIKDYFRRYQASEQAIKMFNLDAIQIHNEDLVMHPRRTIISLCNFLEVSCSDDYIEKCSNKMFSEVSKTRYRIQWKHYQIANITENIQKFDSLLRYSFNS